MKRLLLLLCTTLVAYAASAGQLVNSPTYRQLYELNKQWSAQPDLASLQLPADAPASEKEKIRLHLQLVEQVLRSRSTRGLSTQQYANRMLHLAHLNEYWKQGNFPINDVLPARRPIFIDRYNNFCAVGYLLKSSGQERIARMISRSGNYDYLAGMQYTALDEWVKSCGLSKAELAWIQPGYGPIIYVQSFGKGTDGVVQAFAGGASADDLFVGGTFNTVDGNVSASNIAQYNKALKTWSPLGSGLNGKVSKLLYNANTLYAAGLFTASGSNTMKGIAKWNGSQWSALGSIEGNVNDLVFYNNTLVIAGEFTFTYNSASYHNIAMWDGNQWKPLAQSIDGAVQSLCVYQNQLVAGGSFSHIDGNAYSHIASYNLSAFSALGQGTALPVYSMCSRGDSLYACGPVTNGTDTMGLVSYANGTWINLYKPFVANTSHLGISNATVFHSVSPYKDELVITGSFQFNDFYGYRSGTHVMTYDATRQQVLAGIGIFDSTILAAVPFNNGLVFGGIFKKVYPGGSAPWYPLRDYNSLAYTDFVTRNGIDEASAQNRIRIYPNPTAGRLTIDPQQPVATYSIYDLNGRELTHVSDVPAGKITVEREAFGGSGTYLIVMKDRDGRSSQQTVVIE